MHPPATTSALERKSETEHSPGRRSVLESHTAVSTEGCYM